MARPRRLQETDKITRKQRAILTSYYGLNRLARSETLIPYRQRYNLNIRNIQRVYDERLKATKTIQRFVRGFRARQFVKARGRGYVYKPNREEYNNAHALYKKEIRKFEGRKIKVATLVNGNIIHEVELNVPPLKKFNRWWDRTFMKFLLDSQYTILQDYLLRALLRSRNNEDVKIVITPDVNLEPNQIEQLFAEGVSNCMLKPIRIWAEECLDKAQGRSTIFRYKKIIKDIENYEKEYPTGIPETELPQICNKLQIDISVELPLCKKQFINYQSQKFGLKKFNFVNTRLNHVELNELVNKTDFITVSRCEMEKLAKQLIEENQYFDYNKNKNGNYTRIRTLTNIYQLENNYQEVVNQFEIDTGLINCKLDMINDKACWFINEGVHYNATIDFNFDTKDLKHIDMYRAYAMFYKSAYYQGFLGKTTDWRQLDEDINFAKKNIGFYRVSSFDWSNVDSNKLKVINKLNCYLDRNVYPSAELLFLDSLGVKIRINEGCWGSKIDFKFTEEMFKKDEGIRYYSKWCGSQTSSNHTQSFYMRGSREYFENMLYYTENTNCQIDVYKDGEGVIQYPKEHQYSLPHITGFITAYQRITAIDQLLKMDYDKLVRICVDGIYYKEHEFILIEPFRSKTDIKLGNSAGVSYCSDLYGVYDDDELLFENPNKFRENHQRELFLGAGGNGKTHYNLMDDGFVRMIYVAPSWKLARSKSKEYNIQSTVLARLFLDNYKQSILKYNNVFIIDECSQISEETKEVLFNSYKDCKLIFCGDIGYQMPPIEGEEMTESGFNNTQTFTTNYRFTCNKHKSICEKVRGMIDGDYTKKEINDYIVNQYTQIKAPEDYTPEDIILCSKHIYCDEWTEKYGKTKWKCLENTRESSVGEIFIGDKPKGRWEHRHGYTIHSVQGETFCRTIYIDARDLFDARIGYTAISRAKEWNQIKIIIQ